MSLAQTFAKMMLKKKEGATSESLRDNVEGLELSFDETTKTIEPNRRERPISGQSLFVINTDANLEEELHASNESRPICCVRSLTAIILFASTIIVAALTYYLNRSAELTQFKKEYIGSVVKVEDAITNGIANKINTAKTFSAIYTSRFSADNVWPNATMPSHYFNELAAGQLEVADGIALSFNPIITGKNRDAFEAHASASAHILGDDRFFNRSCDDESGSTCRIVADGIFRKANSSSGEALINIDDPGFAEGSRFPDVLVPVWQIYPTKDNWKAVLFNLHAETKRQHALDDMMEYKVPTITALLHLVQHKDMNPSSVLFFPVFDRFEDGQKGEFFNPRKVVGSVSIVFTWEAILLKVLPKHIEGITVVLQSIEAKYSKLQKRQQWTYDISGEEVTLSGEGDLHEQRFNAFEHRIKTCVATHSERLGIVDNLVTYEIKIYPSAVFKGRYMSRKPLTMTIIVISIFILVSLIFLAYDFLVNHRQTAIMNFASKAGHIVDNLFPQNVRGRLFRHADQRNEPIDDEEEGGADGGALELDGKEESDGKRKMKLKAMRAFLSGRKGGDKRSSSSTCSDSATSLNYLNKTNPIADRFDDTSIMFADIVGFTQWCSEHSPEEVFHLLENLFFEFDKIASRMNVFKLDRVGDCYIAVTGLPQETPDHGVILCQFAEECRTKMCDVFEELGRHLNGADKLTMRFGIHSGPVTAGVLRGQKTRFELFGDTMNFASRMESLSLPGQIQISQEAANLLVAAGRVKWIRPRKDLIHAKGKGLLQTYWLSINDNSLARESDYKLHGFSDKPNPFVARSAVSRRNSLPSFTSARTA